jgi:hypothetical protein
MVALNSIYRMVFNGSAMKEDGCPKQYLPDGL